MELFYLLWFMPFIYLWVMHRLEDHTAFRKRDANQFNDMYTACNGFKAASQFAALSVLLACVQLLRVLKVFNAFSTVYEVLIHSVKMLVPFSLILILGLVMFGFSAMWLFGARVPGLHTWYHTFGLLSFSLTAGKDNLYVFEQMREASNTVAGLWMIVWTVGSTLVFINMFVAVLTTTTMAMRRKVQFEQQLEQTFPPASFMTYLRTKLPSRCIKDPDKLEPMHKLQHDVQAWRMHLKRIEVDKLAELVDKLVIGGKLVLKLQDALELFPHKMPEVSYMQAAEWMNSISSELGVSMRDTEVQKSTADEVNLLAQGYLKLEEEIAGIGHQLRRLVPDGIPKATAI